MDKIQICLLPYGTGNDTASVFGWGCTPGEYAENTDSLMKALINAKQDALTIWNVNVDGDLYDAFDKRIESNDLGMACYFNLGIDAEIGTSFERTRTKSRICNKILYGLYGLYKILTVNSVIKIKDYISIV